VLSMLSRPSRAGGCLAILATILAVGASGASATDAPQAQAARSPTETLQSVSTYLNGYAPVPYVIQVSVDLRPGHVHAVIRADCTDAAPGSRIAKLKYTPRRVFTWMCGAPTPTVITLSIPRNRMFRTAIRKAHRDLVAMAGCQHWAGGHAVVQWGDCHYPRGRTLNIDATQIREGFTCHSLHGIAGLAVNKVTNIVQLTPCQKLGWAPL
jgi:hypothetical protein